MPNIHKKSGVTLTELIVAAAMIGVVMVGVISFTSAVKQMQSSSGKATVMSTRMTAAIGDILTNGSLATGSQNQPGVVVGSGYFSFRQDKNGTPADYSDDTWVIYIKDTDTYQLHSCQQTEAQGGSDPGTPPNGPCALDTARVLFQNLVDVTATLVTDPAVTFDFYIDVSITGRFDPSSAANVITNPEITRSVKISPISHTW